ncbi:MAG: glycosyltransferase family 2 protein [Alphaproteobacteria bacterium]
MPDALIVIPCLNEEDHIGALANQFAKNNPDTLIVIVDGGSTDQTVQIAEGLAANNPNIKYLHNPDRIQSAAVNRAIKTYGGDLKYLIRVDAHAEYPDDYCNILIADAEKTHAASVVVPMHTIGKDPFQRAVAAAQNSLLGNGGSAHRTIGKEGKWVDHGHHALIRINAFRAMAGYDEKFSHNEDAELDARLIRARYRIWLTGKTFLTYYPRTESWSLFCQYFNYGNGRARNILKNRLKPKARQLAPAAVLPAIILALFGFTLPMLIWFFACLAFGICLAVQVQDRWIALSGPAAMLMHLGWSCGFWAGIASNPRRIL